VGVERVAISLGALLAVAVGNAPDHYRDDPKIAPNLALLHAYLKTHYEAQPLLNKVVALWATNRFPICSPPPSGPR